jgi:preprotein translocase subunit SecY
MTKTDPPQNGNELLTTAAPKPLSRWVQLAFTCIPFFIYLLAERIPSPGIEDLEYAGDSPQAYSIVAVGIMPWIIAAVIVGIVALVPRWRPLRNKVVFGRTYFQWATNIVGFHIAAWQAYMIVIWLDTGFIVSADPLPVDSIYAELLFGPKPYASSPPLVFVALVAGAIFVRLLAEVVSLRGLTNGYVVFFAGDLLLWILRMIIRENLGMDMLKLSTCIVACSLPILFFVAQLRSHQGAIQSDKSKDERIDDGNKDNPYAPPNESGSSEQSNPTSP